MKSRRTCTSKQARSEWVVIGATVVQWVLTPRSTSSEFWLPCYQSSFFNVLNSKCCPKYSGSCHLCGDLNQVPGFWHQLDLTVWVIWEVNQEMRRWISLTQTFPFSLLLLSAFQINFMKAWNNIGFCISYERYLEVRNLDILKSHTI